MDLQITVTDAAGVAIDRTDATDDGIDRAEPAATDRGSVEAGGVLPPEDRQSEIAAPPPKFRPERAADVPEDRTAGDVQPPGEVSISAAAPPAAFRGDDRSRPRR